MATDLFESSMRSAGDYAGVFEYDGETGYFYLCHTQADGELKILDHIQMIVGEQALSNEEVRVQWNKSEQRVGCILKGKLWAVFNLSTGKKFGGLYTCDGVPKIPGNEVLELN